ncbi:MAG: phosphotyrosine protein phosphatase [Ponticaulis sp.]|nr:phosphotyrosine protein phosphatase [Ponticaulis sp.]
MVNSVLFVCLGNICRSPTAEAVFDKLARERGLDIRVDSAATSGWHVGSAPHGPMQKAALKRGYDLSAQRARQFRRRDFEAFDLIIVMDQKNRDDVERYRPAGAETPVQLFLDYAPDQDVREVPDPYFTKRFNQAIDLIEQASEGLLTKIVAKEAK